MDLIDRSKIDFYKLTGPELVSAMEEAPSVPAVPLEPLAKWLERNAAGRWNGLEYTAAGWKDELTRWMEEQDGRSDE